MDLNQTTFFLNTNPCSSSGFSTVTGMEGTLSVHNNSDMEEDTKYYPPCQWIQQDTNSAIIKLEPGTSTEASPGK